MATYRDTDPAATADHYDRPDELENIFSEIERERIYQDGRWGTVADDTLNTPWMWTAYITHYASKWMVGSFLPLERGVTETFRTCMVKVASIAIAIAAIQSIDRQRAANGSTFYEKPAD